MKSAEIIALNSTGSTNDDARALASRGADAGTTVWAIQQTAGRGRQGNSWMSEPGNLFMSMVVRPETSAVVAGQLSFLTAVALARTVRELLPPSADIGLKWPNDLILNDKKAAGILLESEIGDRGRVQFIIIGIGVNIVSSPEGATCLKDLGVTGVPVERVMEKLRGHLISLYNIWNNNGFDFADIRAEWIENAYRLGEEIRVRLPQETFTGVFQGIDGTGALSVALPNGEIRNVTSAEVFAL